MESLEKFQRNRRVIEDFTARTLAVIPTEMGRLLHVAMLRDLATGHYRHDGLAEIYSQAAVHEAIAYCHEELLERTLEMPIERQEWDLKMCLSGLGASASEIAARWSEGEFYRLLIPLGAEPYLRDLFCSNVRILLRLIAAESANLPTAA
jgi:hypothetical protein